MELFIFSTSIMCDSLDLHLHLLQLQTYIMDVIFETQRGRAFSIEVGFFDTIHEIKEKIEKYQSIPISRQTLIFKSQVLEDECKIEDTEILQNSKVKLIIDTESSPSNNNNESSLTQICKKTIKLYTKSSSTSSSSSIILNNVEVEPTDTVGCLKQMIYKADPTIPLDGFTLHSNGSDQLQDSLAIGEITTLENIEIELRHIKKNCYPSAAVCNNVVVAAVTATATAPPSSPANNLVKNSSSNKLRVMVLTKGGTKKIPVEVNAGDNVGDLKMELQRLQQTMSFYLPPEGYFFIYRQNVMDDDRSYRWHHVGHGDTIEIFNGSVTGGS